MPLDPRHRDITVRMLLSHCSGLAGYDDRDAFTLYSDSGPSFTGYAAQVLAACLINGSSTTPAHCVPTPTTALPCSKH